VPKSSANRISHSGIGLGAETLFLRRRLSFRRLLLVDCSFIIFDQTDESALELSKLTSKSLFGVQVVLGLYAVGGLRENRVGLG
jgi:hypothetical protein